VSQGPEGYSVDSNIIKAGDWYYAMATGWQWPPNCDGGKGTRPCLFSGGGAPIRTANILDPSSWRGWDGKDFSVVFTDPYLGPVVRPQDHVYTPVPYMAAVNGINFHEPSHLFIATLWDPWKYDVWPARALFCYLAGPPSLEQACVGHYSEPTPPAGARRKLVAHVFFAY
jgi:hypothetical protein